MCRTGVKTILCHFNFMPVFFEGHSTRHKGPSYRAAKNLFSEVKNQDEKPINAKICFFSLIGRVGTRAIFSKSTTFYKINSRPLNSNFAAAVAVAALFVLVSSVTTATTGPC